MGLPYKFVAYRGKVNGVFENYNNVMLDCVERNEAHYGWYDFLMDYKRESLLSRAPLFVELPWLLQVRVGEPVLTMDEIRKGQRDKHYVWYDAHTDNLCTFDYSVDGSGSCVCVLDKSRVPPWLESGCYHARYCLDGPGDMWCQPRHKGEAEGEGKRKGGEEGKVRSWQEHYLVCDFGPPASIVISLDEWVKPLGEYARDLHAPARAARERAALGDFVAPFPKTLREFVESFRLTFNI